MRYLIVLLSVFLVSASLFCFMCSHWHQSPIFGFAGAIFLAFWCAGKS